MAKMVLLVTAISIASVSTFFLCDERTQFSLVEVFVFILGFVTFVYMLDSKVLSRIRCYRYFKLKGKRKNQPKE